VQTDIEVFEGDNRSGGRNLNLAPRCQEGVLLVKDLNFRLESGKSFRIAASLRLATFSLQPFAAAQVSVKVTHTYDIIRIHVFCSSPVVNSHQSPFDRARGDGIHVKPAVGRRSSRKNSKMEPRHPCHPGDALWQAKDVPFQRRAGCGFQYIHWQIVLKPISDFPLVSLWQNGARDSEEL
jgi:hypothetical protein